MNTASTAPSSPGELTFHALVETAAATIGNNDPQGACQAARELTLSHPEQPGAWYLYGSAMMRAGDVAAAIPLLQHAVSLRRASPLYLRSLAQAYRAAGHLDEARETLARALHLEPHDPEAQLSLGLVHIAQGNRDTGVALCKSGFTGSARLLVRRLLKRLLPVATPLLGALRFITDPFDGIAVWVAAEHGRLLERLDEDEAAIQQYQKALESAPEHVPTLARIGRLLQRLDQSVTARPYLELAVSLKPEDTALRTDYGVSLISALRIADAVEELEAVVADDPQSITATLALGRARNIAGDATRAGELFARACEMHPQSAAARFALGTNRQEQGDFESANEHFREALELDPKHASAFRSLASNDAITPDSPEFDDLLALLESGELGRKDRLPLHFAAATVLERAGDPDAAFAHYRRGNELKDVVFGPATHAAYIDSLIETYDAAHFDRVAAWGDPDASPIFILGMPRSGTSLTEQVLASHPDVFGAGELELFNGFADGLAYRLDCDKSYPECVAGLDQTRIAEMVSEHQQALHALAGDAPRVSDKMPNNYLHVGLILTLYPNARIVHCRRDPRDICFSIYALDFSGNHPYAYDQVNLGSYYREYERLMAHWHRVAPDRILAIDYEDMVEDLEGTSRRMLDFCGLEWDARCLDFHKTERTVRTWSYRQVRQPIYKTSVARWRKFEEHLQPLLRELDLRHPPSDLPQT